MAAPTSQLDGFSILLLVTAVGMILLAEGVSLVWFDRTSQVQQRELAQRRTLLQITPKDGSVHIGLIGNSLMLDGVDVPILVRTLGHEATPVPYFVLATNYYDWYYGLKRLFAEGMHPQYVVLGLSPNQFASSQTRGDYSAHYLFRGEDLWEVARRTQMDLTTASGFFLSHFSEYYSTRDISRGFVMSRVLPTVGQLLHQRLSGGRAEDLDQDMLAKLAAERLPALDKLCRENGSHFMLVVPPTYQKGADVIARVGEKLNIQVIVPVSSSAFDEKYYKADGFHLNERGSMVFSASLGESLLREIGR